MLAANRDKVLAELQAGAAEMRWKELDNVIFRFQSLIAITGLSAGFSFEAMVHLEIPEDEKRSTAMQHWVHTFFVLTSGALILSLYVVAASTFAISAGYRLALQGSGSESVARAVAVLLVEFRYVFFAATIAMVCILLASMTVVWIKLEEEYDYDAVATGMFSLAIVVIFAALARLRYRLSVPATELVQGDVFIRAGNGQGIEVGNIELGGPGMEAKPNRRASAETEARELLNSSAAANGAGRSGV